MITLPLPLTVVFLYVMVYTVGHGREIWRSGNKFGGTVIFLLAALIPAILIRLVIFS